MESSFRAGNLQFEKLPEQIFDVNLFREITNKIISERDKTIKKEQINQLLLLDGLFNHHTDKATKRVVLANYSQLEYPHEHHTSKKLTSVNYDVIFVPNGYFKRGEKKFDVFLTRDHIFLEADLKSITSKNSDTIGNRIKEGSLQAARIVLDITSPIQKRQLIDGLKLGCQRNDMIKEILLFYNSKFYRLPVIEILSKRIFDIIK